MPVKVSERGDTIVEVILAMALLSMIIFIAWGTTNRATQISTNARKRVVMVNALKEQAEIIKSVYRQPNGSTASIIDSLPETDEPAPNPCNDANMSASPTTIASAFHYKTDGINVSAPDTNYKVVEGDDGARVWIQYVNDPEGRYVDFYVRGCWFTLGGSEQLDNSQFIVRLNS